ncbi:hypothetical protein GWI33_023221 [Rhynchophorus ferrugineus]|uniref:Uncharacterized protein n=1 Tax=Rhynchophorus ferrugineus TaxID=354439 RepID=A0A834LZ26_RHYFE|nr:hypothetical protein GWI33_023221 [Rhynchophorus ferrugineus]
MFHEPLKTRPAFLINLRSELEATRPKGGANGAGANSNVQCKLYLKQTGPPARPYSMKFYADVDVMAGAPVEARLHHRRRPTPPNPAFPGDVINFDLEIQR